MDRPARAKYHRGVRYQRAEASIRIKDPGAARSFFSGLFAKGDGSRERLWVAHLDGAGRCVHVTDHEGDAGGVEFPLREIIVDAARHHSAAILLAHNHPSGDPRPSNGDLRATRRLAAAAEALDCRIVDHLVFAGTECSSFRHLGYL